MMNNNEWCHKVFCAIDLSDYDQALAIAEKTVPHTKAYKLGLTFFNKNGFEGVKSLKKEIDNQLLKPADLFLDLKLHDIPAQVAGAVRAIVPLEPAFLTIHTSGGKAMMEAAVKAAKDEAEKLGVQPPKILGVTVLTSLDGEALTAVGQGSDVEQQVIRLAALAKESGLDGVICSPLEIVALRKELGADMILMVPGVRPAGSSADDQKRVMTPDQAVEAGATHLVIGRPITESDDPAFTIQFIKDEIERYSEI